MKPIIKYTGGKMRQATWICEHFPEHSLYVEPFFGMGSVFFYKNPSKVEIINDLDNVIYNFWRVIKSPKLAQKLAEILSVTPMHESIFDELKEGSDDPVDKAMAFLVLSKLSFKFNRNLAKNDFYIPRSLSRIDRIYVLAPQIKAYTERLKNTFIHNKCALSLISKYSQNQDALIYLDPPYVEKGSCYNEKIDHRKMIHLIKEARCKIILSGYHSNLYTSELLNWRIKERQAQTMMHSPRTECIWMNF